MMPHELIASLLANRGVFEQLFKGVPERQQSWRPDENTWCLLEVLCHLYDEEREDFRHRTRLALYQGEGEVPEINPVAWVSERAYMQQDYHKVLTNFLTEREKSVKWLGNLERPDWTATFMHPKFGAMSAERMLANWLAHDYHHIRQVNQLKYLYLRHSSGQDLTYAGKW
jgi:hypothetical protein